MDVHKEKQSKQIKQKTNKTNKDIKKMNFGEILIYCSTFFGLYTSIYFLLILFERKGKIKKGETNIFQKVTICVPCYNEEKTIIKTLKSLFNLDYPNNKLEIIVVDDGSGDFTYKKAKEFQKQNPNFNLKIFKKKNGGKYTALNLAIDKSTGDFFGALDADSFVDKKALRRIMKFFEDKNVTAVTPSMKVYKPKSIFQKIQSIEYLLGIFLRKIFAELGSLHVTPGPFSIYRKIFFKEHGKFRKAHHTEDIELALRAQKHHKVIENAVDAYVYTIAPSTFKTLYKQRIRWYSGFLKNVLEYKTLLSLKHGNLGIFILPSAFLSIFLIVVFFFYFLYKQIDLFILTYLNLVAINFDLSQLEWPSLNTFFLNTSAPVVLGLTALIFGVIVITIAKNLAEEKSKITFSYILFMLSYWILFAFWWIISFIHSFILKTEIKWGHKSEH